MLLLPELVACSAAGVTGAGKLSHAGKARNCARWGGGPNRIRPTDEPTLVGSSSCCQDFLGGGLFPPNKGTLNPKISFKRRIKDNQAPALVGAKIFKNSLKKNSCEQKAKGNPYRALKKGKLGFYIYTVI